MYKEFDPRKSIVESTIDGLQEANGLDISPASLSTWADRFVAGNESKSTEDMENLILAMLIEMCHLTKQEDRA